MDERPYTTEWWRWQMYRQVAAYVNEPSSINEARLRALIEEYRNQCAQALPCALSAQPADYR